jgi:glycosyltransferase involved in cell wall biosynthesis
MEQAVNSVLAQTHKNWELIIVGDGVWPIAQTWLDFCPRVQGYKITKKVHYPTIHPLYGWLAGPCRAINFGLSHVRGDWIARIDDDDVWTPKHLEIALKRAKEHNLEFVSFPIDLNGVRPEADVFYGQRVGGVQSWLYRGYLKCFRTNLHCWRKKWNAVNDVDLAQRMARAGVRMRYFASEQYHAIIKPRPGLKNVGIKGWLEENEEEQNAERKDFSGGDTGQGRQQGRPEQEH